jgi:hypothetical protein
MNNQKRKLLHESATCWDSKPRNQKGLCSSMADNLDEKPNVFFFVPSQSERVHITIETYFELLKQYLNKNGGKNGRTKEQQT